MQPSDDGPHIVGQYIDSYLPALDGVIITVHNYARWLSNNHCVCYVAAPEAPRGYRDHQVYEVVRYRSVPIRSRPPYRAGIPLLDREFVTNQRLLYPDLVHAHTPFAAGTEALRIARLRSIPMVATFHSKYYDDILRATGSRVLSDVAVRAIAAFYEAADFVWTVNESTADTLRSYGYRGEIEICENGVDLPLPEDVGAARASVDRRFGLTPQDRVVLFVGQHIAQKNLPMLVEACALCRQKGLALRLLSVGDGIDRPRCMEQAKALGLEDTVLFIGNEPDRAALAALYLRADVFAFPSLYDNAPLVVREAAWAGCPSILVRGSNAAEGTVDGDNAFLCENSAHSLAAALARALSDDETRRRVGERARQTLARPWQDIVSDVYRRYKEIIARYRERKGAAQ